MMTRDELAKLTRDLEAGNVADLYTAIHTLGNEGFIEAKGAVERFLTHHSAEIRYIALNVLTFHWMCADHRVTCERFIANDPDSDCRRMGVGGLGALLRGTRDATALSLLLSIFDNQREEWDVRDSAYSQILYVLGKPAAAQPTAARRLDYNKDVNWTWVQEAKALAIPSPRP